MFHHYTSIDGTTSAARAVLQPVNGFVIQEKVDGSNIQIAFMAQQPPRVGRRNAFLLKDEQFYGIWDTMAQPHVQALLACVQAHVDATGARVTLFGEYFGPGVQRRIDYGPERRILFFDADRTASGDSPLEPQRLSPKEFEEFMCSLGLTDWLVPKLARMETLADALDYDCNHASRLSPPEADSAKNVCEGVVIKPWDSVVKDKYGHVVYMKKKNSAFQEVERSKGATTVDPQVESLRADFQRYLNVNRVLSVLSKEGRPAQNAENAFSNKDIGRLCKLMLQDAREDYTKDNSDALAALTKQQRSQLFGKHHVWNIVQKAIEQQAG